MPKITEYALMVGEEGAPRLRLLNKMCNPSSLSFIENTVDLKNKNVLDLGCGIGILSAEIAKRIQPKGTIVAADISNEQLEIAKKFADHHKINNISFKQVSAKDIDQLSGKFDIIYCRFLLAHLTSINEIISKIMSLMHQESLLICEEPNSVESLYCKPSYPVFEKWKEAVTMQVIASKANFDIGKSLYTLFLESKLKVINVATTQAQLNTSELKQQLWQGIIEITPLLLSCSYASENELNELVQELKHFANNSVAEIGYVECTQISARL